MLDALIETIIQTITTMRPAFITTAMKMEHRIQAPKAGEVVALNFSEGERVDMGATLVELGD